MAKKRSDIYQASASKAKRASARINDPLNEAGSDLSSLSEGAYLVFLQHKTFNFVWKIVTSPSFTIKRLCHQRPGSCSGLLECGNRRSSTHIFCAYTIFKSDSSNYRLLGRPSAPNVVLICFPQEGDRRGHVIVPVRILSALLLFSHSGMHLRQEVSIVCWRAA